MESAGVAPVLGAPLPGVAVFVFLCDYLAEGFAAWGEASSGVRE